MDQPLFPEETPPATPTTTPPTNPEPSPAAEPGPSPEVKALSEQVQGIAQSVESLTGALQQAVSPPPAAPEPTEPERVEPNDYLSTLANDPQETIRKEAAEIARKVVQDSVGDVGAQLVETQHQILMQQQEQQIDTEFGKGTFEEVYRPQMEPNLKLIREKQAAGLANPETIQILVDRVTGQQRRALNEREVKAREKQQEEWLSTKTEIASSLPPSGPRRGSADGTTPDDDTKLFLAEVGQKTGERMDPEKFLKMMHAGNKLEDYERVQKESS